MAQKVKRDATRPLRLSKGELAKTDEDAAAAGLEWSEYVRRELGIKNFGRSGLRRAAVPAAEATRPEGREISRGDGEEFARRVKQAALRMPRRAAENVVRRELEREKAKADLT